MGEWFLGICLLPFGLEASTQAFSLSVNEAICSSIDRSFSAAKRRGPGPRFFTSEVVIVVLLVRSCVY